MPDLIPSTTIDDVLVVRPEVHGDERGRFIETYRRSWFPLGREMVQANRSEKQAGAVVGLHYHLHQADYWLCPRGTARVVQVERQARTATASAHRVRTDRRRVVSTPLQLRLRQLLLRPKQKPMVRSA